MMLTIECADRGIWKKIPIEAISISNESGPYSCFELLYQFFRRGMSVFLFIHALTILESIVQILL